jgi:hypothetical protein
MYPVGVLLVKLQRKKIENDKIDKKTILISNK